jgi:PDZ domain-containing protein
MAVPEATEPHADPLPKLARVWWVTGPLLVVTLLAALVITFLPSGYFVDAAGSAVDTTALVKFPAGVKTYSHEGGIRFVTVSETSRPIFGQALAGWLKPTSDVFPRKAILGNVGTVEEQRFGAVLMLNSKHAAAYQALARLGLKVQMTGGGVFVEEIVDGSPAKGRLSIGDTITEIDGTSVHTVNDISRYMKTATIGRRITITVNRLGVSQAKKVPLTIGSTTRDGKRVPFLGIYMQTSPHFQFPFDVEIDTGNVGGPSAGLALTLSIMDQLSPTSVTNGNEVAVTGTIQVDGSVGEIGGIRQKVAAVREAGVHYFLVPTANVHDAKEVAGSDLKIIPVKSLDDALAKLKELPKQAKAATSSKVTKSTSSSSSTGD